MKKEELLKRTKKELLALASEKGMRLSARLRKSDLVDQVLSLFPPRKRSRPQVSPGTIQSRSPRKRPAKSAARKRRAPSRAEVNSPEPITLSREELHRISESISRLFPPPISATEIVLLDVDPFHAHAFWHVRLEDMESARKSLGPEGEHAALLLRFYDVTLLDFDGNNAHSWFDVAVHSLQSNTYIDFWESGRGYLVDIGLRTHDGRFHTLARSNPIELPPHGPSSNFDRTGVVVDAHMNIVCEVADVTRAEWLDEIRPEPRPDMAPGTSDDLVRSFYRRLTNQNPTGAFRPRRPPTAPETRPIPEEHGGILQGAETPSAFDESHATLQAEEPKAVSETDGSPAGGQSVGQTAGPLSWSAVMQEFPSEPLPVPISLRSSAESSYGVYGARRERSGVSSWTHSAGGESSWVTSPGGGRDGESRLEQVFVLPLPQSSETASVAEVSAELVVQGRAAPGSPLSLFGQPVRVRPDGTFSIRMRLPEGTMVVPMPAHGEKFDEPDSEGGPS